MLVWLEVISLLVREGKIFGFGGLPSEMENIVAN